MLQWKVCFIFLRFELFAASFQLLRKRAFLSSLFGTMNLFLGAFCRRPGTTVVTPANVFKFVTFIRQGNQV